MFVKETLDFFLWEVVTVASLKVSCEDRPAR